MSSTPCDRAAAAPAGGQAADAGSPTPVTTPWFDGNTQPVQIGVYQRRNSLGHVCYSLWDGSQWYWNQPSPTLADRESMPSMAQYLPWRGLVQPPAEGYGPGAAATEGSPC